MAANILGFIGKSKFARAGGTDQTAPDKDTNLYEKLGGEVTIKAVVEEFYKRVLGNPQLKPVFEGTDMGRLKRHQALFISQALGGPKLYDGRDMKAAHAGLGITGEQFDAVATHLVDTLNHFKVGQADIDTIVGVVGPLRDQVVSSEPAPAATETPAVGKAAAAAPASLYDKLGGEATIKAVVDEFYKRVLGNPQLKPVFEGTDMGGLKRHQALFISQALGGPKQYDGRDMKAAHAGLGITDEQFDAVATHLVATLNHFKVDQADIDTIVGVVAPLKDQVVSSQGAAQAAEAPAAAPAKPKTPAKPETPATGATAVAVPAKPVTPAENLYEKLGGGPTVKAAVKEFYKRVLGDKALAPVFENTDTAKLKRHQALFISQVLGGPKSYDGKTMYQAHKYLDVTDEQFDKVAGHLKATLESLKVAAQDIDTILSKVGPLRRDIVSDHFKRWLRGG